MEPDEVRQLRCDLSLTQTQLATELCVSEMSVRHWEQGRRNPSSTAVLAMGWLRISRSPTQLAQLLRDALVQHEHTDLVHVANVILLQLGVAADG